jgi:hypothetical protein
LRFFFSLRLQYKFFFRICNLVNLINDRFVLFKYYIKILYFTLFFTAFVESFILSGRLTIGLDDIRVGAVRFASTSTPMLYLEDTTTAAELAEHFTSAEYTPGAGTRIGEGIRVARQQVGSWSKGDRPEAQDIFIVLTDGYGDVSNAIRQANAAKSEGTYMITLGIGDDINEDFLRELSSGDYMYHIPQWEDMPAFVDTLLDATCQVSYKLGRFYMY